MKPPLAVLWPECSNRSSSGGRPIAQLGWRICLSYIAVIIAHKMIEGTDDDLTFGNWENATPEKMKTWTERKLFAAQMHNRGGVYDSWAQAELARRRNLALAELISSLKESTDKVHQEVTVLSSSSDRLEDLTRQLKNLTWALIVLTVAAVIATVVVPIWVERTSDALQAAPVSEPPKQ